MRWGRHILLVLLLGVWTSRLPAQPRPNVILITVDTLRADHLEAYGYEGGRTPAITALAEEGILFENVIAQTPITLPSHATLFTGTYPFYHGLQDVVGRLRDDIPTLAEWFRDRGYRTAAVVGSSVLMAEWGLDRGFDYYEDTFNPQGFQQIDFSRVERPAGRVVELAREWIRTNRSAPFFLWMHLYDPHDPYIPRPPFAEEFAGRPYDGEIAYVDSELSGFFDFLKEAGLYDSALIAFTADHGEMLGEHKEKYHAYYLYDAALRVPLIFKLPAAALGERFSAGTRLENQARLLDVAPTLMQLLREEVPGWVQGQSLVAMMAGRRPGLHLPAYSETHYPRIHFGWSSLFSYSTPEHKFIEAPQPELYDLVRDPGELNNLYESRTALAHQLQAAMHELQRKFAGAGEAQGDEKIDPETLERLKALGYVAFSAGSGGTSSEAALPDPKDKIDTYNELNRAIELSREGESRQAIDLLEDVARREPEMPIVHFLLGTEYFNLGMSLKAAEEFTETIRYNPDSNVARFSLARAYSHSGLSDRAMEVARELLASDPRHFGARHLVATLLARKGKYREAVEEERKALEIRPSFADGHNNLGSYYLQLDLVEPAIESYLKALHFAPGSILARNNLCLAYLKQDRFREAEEQALLALGRAPESALSHYYLGQAYLGQGKREDARRAFERARQLDPKLNVPPL